MDFSDLGGTAVQTADTAVQSSDKGIDFSDLGGVPVTQDEGALAAAARGALRNFPLGQQAAAAIAPINPFSEKGTYSEELQHLTEAAKIAKEQHPVAYGAGAVGGTLAPLAIPGVGEALAAESLPASMAANAAISAAGSQSDTNLTQFSRENAKEALQSGAIGAGTAGLFKLLGPAASKSASSAAEGAEETPDAVFKGIMTDPVTNEQTPLFNVTKAGHELEGSTVSAKTLQDAGLEVPEISKSPAVVSDLKPSAERVYASNIAQGLGGTPRQLMRVFGRENPVQSLNEIGNWMDTAGEGGKSLHGLMDRPGELLEKIDGIHDSSGKTIGSIIDDLAGAEGPKINDPVNLLNVKKELSDFAARTADPQTEARILKLVKTVDSLGEKDLTGFDILQQIKEMSGKQIAKDPEMSQIYGSLADRLNKVVDAYGEAIDNPNLRSIYDKAKLDYHNSSRLLPLLIYSEARELTGGAAGHSMLRNLIGSIAKIGGSVAGLPPSEQIGRNILLKTAPLARNLANLRIGAANRMSPAAVLGLSNALTSAYGTKGGQNQ